MEIIYGILVALVLAHLIMAITASVVIIRDNSLGLSQIVFKLIVAWVGLFIGPQFILYVMNEHSPELIPNYAQTGLIHSLLFLPIKPPPHNDRPEGNDGGSFQNTDASDIGFGGEGTCGGD